MVHVHYGLTAWCGLLAGARPLVVTFHGTDVRHPVVGPLSRRLAPRVDLVAAVSRALFGPEDGRRGLPPAPASVKASVIEPFVLAHLFAFAKSATAHTQVDALLEERAERDQERQPAQIEADLEQVWGG